jgi:hypothetical protein
LAHITKKDWIESVIKLNSFANTLTNLNDATVTVDYVPELFDNFTQYCTSGETILRLLKQHTDLSADSLDNIDRILEIFNFHLNEGDNIGPEFMTQPSDLREEYRRKILESFQLLGRGLQYQYAMILHDLKGHPVQTYNFVSKALH